MTAGGFVYHVLNRGNARQRIFDKDEDYLAFERILAEVQERVAMRILAWCLMPNHWHLVLWPQREGELSDYLRLVSLVHTQRRHAHRATAGSGHVYQGRFKSFMVQDDVHFLAVCRYVEANALRANLVQRAEAWRWCSLWRSVHGRADLPPRIASWPLPRPSQWVDQVNDAETNESIDDIRRCVRHGTPYGQAGWAQSVAMRFGLECTLRPRGRPTKKGPDPFFTTSSPAPPSRRCPAASSAG